MKFDINEITEAEVELLRNRNELRKLDLDILDMFEVQEEPEEDEEASDVEA